MKGSKNFLLQGYSSVSVLKKSENGTTEIVKGLDQHIYVRKRLPFANLPYRKLQKLACPYLPHIYFVAENDYETIIIEEYIQGSNLQELLDNGTVFADEQVRNMGVHLCDALIALHEAEILHRDIKPSNIMQTNDGRIKLVDFGAARIVRDGSQDTRLLGTPGFAPPEQFGFATTDKRSDIYALGKTLQALVGNNAGQQLLEIINKCTELDPERRLASAEELRKLLLAKKSHKKYVSALLAVMLLAGGAVMYQQRDVAPQAQTLQQQMQEQADDKKAAPKENDRQDHDKQGKPSTPKQPAPPSTDDIANNKVEQEKVGKQAAPAAEVQAADVGFYSWDWIFTDKIRGNYWREEEKAKAAGTRFVQFLENTPYLVIVNKSDRELQDPYLVLDFQDFEVDGQNESYQAYGNRQDIVEFYEKSALGYKRVVLRLKGTVLPHDEHSQFFYGAIYQTGVQPKVKITLMVGDKILLQDVVHVKVQYEQ